MKQNKGITIMSLIVYVIAMTIAIGIIATISTRFYANVNELNVQTQSVGTYTKLNSFITNEINTKNNTPIYPSKGEGDDSYCIFSQTNNQYTFQDNSIYLNNIKICANIESCTFSYNDDNELTITYKTQNGEEYTNTYKIVNY